MCRDPSANRAHQAVLKDDHEQQRPHHRSGQQHAQVSYMSLTKACICVIRSLSEERDWEVLKLILAQVGDKTFWEVVIEVMYCRLYSN